MNSALQYECFLGQIKQSLLPHYDLSCLPPELETLMLEFIRLNPLSPILAMATAGPVPSVHGDNFDLWHK